MRSNPTRRQAMRLAGVAGAALAAPLAAVDLVVSPAAERLFQENSDRARYAREEQPLHQLYE